MEQTNAHLLSTTQRVQTVGRGSSGLWKYWGTIVLLLVVIVILVAVWKKSNQKFDLKDTSSKKTSNILPTLSQHQNSFLKYVHGNILPKNTQHRIYSTGLMSWICNPSTFILQNNYFLPWFKNQHFSFLISLFEV